MDATTETWLPVVGHRGYEVSDHGNVRSVDRTVVDSRGRRLRLRGRRLTPTRFGSSRRYLLVSLGSHAKASVHHLVATAFLGERPFPAAEVCHDDNDGANNQVDNLRWDTRSNNALDRVRHGTHPYGNRSACARGHELVEPNLVPSERIRRNRIGGRSCLACCRAKANARHAAKQGVPFDMTAAADAAYCRIMDGTSHRYGGPRCQRGHLRTPENTRLRRRDGRECRECRECVRIRTRKTPVTHD